MKRIQCLKLGAACSAVLLIALAKLSIAQQQTLPIDARITLEKAIKGWNYSPYGERGRIEGWNYERRISTEKERESVLGRLLDPERAHFPDLGNESKLVRLLRLVEVKSISKESIVAWQREIANFVQIGQHVVNLRWREGVKRFATLTVTNNSTVVYDTILSNVVLARQKKGSFVTYFGWIWQYNEPNENFTRGKIEANVTPRCGNGSLLACDKNCSAYLTLGDAKINCRCKEERFCNVDYSYAWKTGFNRIKVGIDRFTLEVEGVLGTGGNGNGSFSEYCR